MSEDNQSSNNISAEDKLRQLGYNDFTKRILNHSEFTKCTLECSKFTHWSSPAIDNLLRRGQSKIDYKHSGVTELLLEKEYATEMITVDDFLKLMDDDIVEIKLKFTHENQSLVHYSKTRSTRSIYAWGNNVSISHLTNDYEAQDAQMWQCGISKYGLNTRLWYPVNIIANAPWHNPSTGENTVIPVNYVCLGLDQAVAASNIGLEVTPQLDDIINVATSPEALLNDDLKPFTDEYNQQMLNSEYKFNPLDKSGWLFVAIKGYVFTRTLIIRTVDKRQNRRYFSFI